MPIIVKDNAEGKDFTPAPAGVHAAVCCDVRDLGIIPGFQSKPQHKILVSWLIDETRDDGKLYMVSKRYTASLNEKAALTADLESWRGKPFTEAEKDGFDVEVLIGKGCMLNVVHNTKNDKTYANVQAIMPLAKGMAAPKIPSDFVRFVDRPADDGPPAHEDQLAPPSDDEIPF